MSVEQDLSRFVRGTTGKGQPVTAPGTVTAVREDGCVNVRIRGQLYLGAVCADSYTGRAKGDRVHVISFQGMQYVSGRMGPDPSFLQPNVTPAYYNLYNYPNYQYVANPEAPGQAGCSGGPGDGVPLATGWSYWNGTVNTLTAAAKVSGKTTATLLLTRTADKHGSEGPTTVQVLPHNWDTLPTGVGIDSIRFAPVTGLTEVYATLELGEAVYIDLPSDWFAAMITTTPTVRGVALAPVLRDSTGNSYAKLSPVAGSVRVHV